MLLAVLAAACTGGPKASTRQASTSRAGRGVGRLVLVGGRIPADEVGLYTAVLNAREGKGPVCVLPVASGAPVSDMEAVKSALDGQGGDGTASTIFLSPEDAARANDPEIVGEIARCSGFFFTAGEPSRLTQVLMPAGDTTLALRAILERYHRGAVVAATGGTIAAMGSLMIVGGESREALADGVTATPDTAKPQLDAGLGLVGRTILDAHFLADGRVGRLLVAVLAADSLPVGLGLAEGTALVIDGDSARVTGRSGVVVLDARGAVKVGPHFARGVRATLAGEGDRIDLRTLSVAVGAGKAALAAGRATRPVRDVLGPWGFLHVMANLAGSTRMEASFAVPGARLTIRKASGFSASGLDSTGMQGEPAGLSAGPFVVDLVPVGG